MITNAIRAGGIILVLFSGWVLVQHLARRFALRHPELGAGREEGDGCGGFCLCSRAEQASCPNRQSPPSALRPPPDVRATEEGHRHFREPPIAVAVGPTASEKTP